MNVTDGEEATTSTRPNNPDSDADGFTDGEESIAHTDPLDDGETLKDVDAQKKVS